MAIFYEGVIATGTSEVTVTAMSVSADFTIPTNHLQYGYRLYKEDYNLEHID